MDADVMEKEKGSLPAEQEKQPAPVVSAEPALPGSAETPPAPKVPRGLLYYHRLQQESEAREKKMMAELEAKHEMLSRKLEASFALKEHKLLEDFRAAQKIECVRLEQVAADKVQSLLGRMAVVRRQRSLAVIVAVLSLAAVVGFRARSKDASQSALPPLGSGQAAAPHSVDALASDPAAHAFAFAVVATVPDTDPIDEVAPLPDILAGSAAAPAAPAAVVRKGNGGNFSGGNLY